MQQPRQSTLPIIPESKASVNLSPFTWNHLTLPPLMKFNNSIQIKHNSQKGQDKLATITEAKQRMKNVTVSLNKRPSRQQKPQSKNKNFNKTIVAESTLEVQKNSKNKLNKRHNNKQVCKTIDFMDNIQKIQKIKIIEQTSYTQRYAKHNLPRNVWRYKKQTQSKETYNTERFSDHHYDHIQGSSLLTNKDYLHELMQVNGKQFYPLSFLIPKDFEVFMLQNNKIAVKLMLRLISMQIVQYLHTQNMKDNSWSETKVHLGDILQSAVIQTGSQHTKILVKLCMYLQNIRVQQQYQYFQRFPGYFKIKIKPKTHLFEKLINQAAHYLDGNVDLFLKINYRSIDFRLLVLILHYDQLFKQNQATFDTPYQLWIVKPFVQTKSTDIAIMQSSSQFCSTQNSNKAKFKTTKKYENKIIQKYIANPYLLTTPPAFAQRKFKIRQWVLLIGGRQTFSIYKYQNAYCRFASRQYDCSKLQKEIHLDELKTKDENNIMTIQELFEVCRQDLRGKYAQQSGQIIKSVIMNSKCLKSKEDTHQIFVFDFLVDSSGRLYLLSVNFNTDKTIKHQKLKQQNQTMMKTMKELVVLKKNDGEKWVKLFGSEMRHEDSEIVPLSEIEVKPFYKCSLEQGQSLIQLIRQRRRIFSRLKTIIQNFQSKCFFKLLKGQLKQVEVLKLKDKQSLAVKIQNNKTNKVQSQVQIHFIEERQLSNL